MPDHHTARHLASRLAALARALAVRALMGSLVPDHLVLGLRAQPLLDLVNAPLRAALGLAAPGASGVPAGMQAGASRFVSADDTEAWRANQVRLLVLDAVPVGPLPDTVARRCSTLLPLPALPQLPAQVLLCPVG